METNTALNSEINKIEPSIIIEEVKTNSIPSTDTSEDDLQKRLKNITETKIPGSEEKKRTTASKFWDASPDDFSTTEAKKEDVKKEEPKKEEPEEKEPIKKSAPLSETLKRGSANSAVGMLDFTARLLFPPILNYKLKKKFEKSFTEKDKNLIEEKLQDADEKSLEDDELRIKRRFDKIMKKHDKKMEDVPFTDPEKKEIYDAVYNYVEVTGKELDPSWYLGLTIINVMGKRAIDTFTD